MISLKHGWKAVFLLLLAGPVLAEVQPISLTFFGLYGSPVQPLGLASSTTDILGFNVLGEWNPSDYASLGLGFEQATFYSNPGFNFSTANFEGRVFPFQNGKDKFSPYAYGGAGLVVSNGGGTLLKAGLGSRVSFIGPLFLDFSAGSHWIVSPGNAQYVDFRAGLSYSIELNPKPTPTATPAPTATPSPTVLPVVSLPGQAPTPTPAAPVTIFSAPQTIFISQAPVTTLAQGKRYYKLGMKSFKAGDYKASFKYLKKSLELKERHKRAYYYAETYATLGVIYQFHARGMKDHLQKALDSYKKALAIDPTTKSAKHYYKPLKAQLAREAKMKAKAMPGPTVAPTTAPVPSSPSASTPTPSASSASDAITLN